MIAIIVCLTVFNFALVGIVVYGIIYISQIVKEQRNERLSVRVLIESITELFESKYYEDDDKGGIGPNA